MKVSKMASFPCVMGIVNVTPDSFYAASRVEDERELRRRVRQILDEGGSMIDVGACSTRPGSEPVSADEELERLGHALPIVSDAVAEWQGAGRTTSGGGAVLVSVDTFRAQVAETCVRELGADIINDISGGQLDEAMLGVVARTGATYIMTHSRGTPQTMQTLTDYGERGVVDEVARFFGDQLKKLAVLCGEGGLPCVLLDPGFGFAKTQAQNYALLRGLDRLRALLPGHPLLVGMSRKSMVYGLLGTDAGHSLNGTTVVNTYALLHGASVLRVHDVKEAAEAIRICGILA